MKSKEGGSMLDLEELKQLIAFEKYGTLSKVAEEFHRSTPSVTRSMQHLEECFGVPLFERGKNKIALNESGNMAVERAKRLLEEAETAIQQVRLFDQRRRTIVIRSCAPAPLWEILKQINTQQENRMVSSAICQNEEVLSSIQDGSCDIAILPFPIENSVEWMREQLYVCVPKDHELAGHETLSFEQINGFNFLIRTELGFWDTLCRRKMPASKFLVQPDVSIFEELVKASSLPCFTTDYTQSSQKPYEDRIQIPLIDPEAKVKFYVIQKDSYLQKK